MSRTTPDPQPGFRHQDPDDSRDQPQPWASELADNVEVHAWAEVADLVNSLAYAAWFVPPAHQVSKGRRKPTRPRRDHLSEVARQVAQGVWLARFRPNPYLTTRANVCLDCGWVGTFDVVPINHDAERLMHDCLGARR